MGLGERKEGVFKEGKKLFSRCCVWDVGKLGAQQACLPAGAAGCAGSPRSCVLAGRGRSPLRRGVLVRRYFGKHPV